jgi:hypothetical protein
LRTALEVLLLFVALYPVVTAALWIAGGLTFKLIDERSPDEAPAGGWPGVTVLIPAYNEEAVIAQSVGAALASDYPILEVLVLDDGSTDDTAGRAAETAAGDPRCEVVRDDVNRGKAAQLNKGSRGRGTSSSSSRTRTRTCIPTRSATSSPTCTAPRWSRLWPEGRSSRTGPTSSARCRCWRRRPSSA